FTLGNNNAMLQSLAEGQAIIQVYTVTFTDNHGAQVSQDVTVTINGANDAPTITSDAGAATGAVIEDEGSSLSACGTLAIQDLDLVDTHTAVWSFKSSSVSTDLPGFGTGSHIGTFSIDSSVTESSSDTSNGATLGWHFTLDNSDSVLQSLAEGQTITQVYTVTFDDQHGGKVSQDVTVTITGTNDAPTLDSTTLAAVAGDESDPGGGTISDLFANKFHDADTGAAFKAVAVTSNAAASTEGVWQYEIAGTDQWVDIGSVSDTQALVLSPDTLIRFVPANGFTGTPDPLGVHALDDTYAGAITTDVLTPATIDLTTTGTGGTTPVSHELTTIDTSVTAPAGGPVIHTESVLIERIIENSNEIITDLWVDPASGAATDTFTVTLSTAHPDTSIASVYPTSGTLDQINTGLATGAGIAYDPTGASTDQYPTPPATDQITLTVTDTTTGLSDTVHFIFNEAGNTSQAIELEGTGGKDVILATDTNDTLIGGGGKDQFVFSPNASGSDGQHTIDDFQAGLDKIDLRQFSDISSIGNLTIVQQQNSVDTLVTWQQQVTLQAGAPVTEHESLLLKNVIAANLKASDFIFHIT
ncbi:VCBS domain-containing protein, partial [Bradyrhizobium cajani]